MKNNQTCQRRLLLFPCAVAIALLCLAGPACQAQDAPPEAQATKPPTNPLEKYPGLQEELLQLLGELYNDIQLPAARAETRLLPLLPSSTIAYVALPNYGYTAKQALDMFRQARRERPALRRFWQDPEMREEGPKTEGYVEKFAELFQYLGEEVVISAAMDGRQPRLLFVAEIKKPGLREFVGQLLDELPGSTKAKIRVLGPQDLADAQEPMPDQSTESPDEFLVLVRSDFVVVAQDLGTLRSFTGRVESGSQEFAATPFGQRTLQEFPGGLTLLAGANLQGLVDLLPPGARQDAIFQATGFADLKYFLWGHKTIAGQTVSQTELSFSSPRHGVASWLGKSGPLGSLDFVSPSTVMAATVVLKDPVLILDDLLELAALTNANPLAEVAPIEQALQLSLKDDLLSHLGGELTAELVDLSPPAPGWKAILSVKNAERLQQTLTTLLTAAALPVERLESDGIAYQSVSLPTSQPMQIVYALVDGYLIAGSSKDVVTGAVAMHRSGDSLLRSAKFQAAHPPGQSQGASGALYMDTLAVSALQMRRIAPALADAMEQSSEELPPMAAFLYGDDAAIRHSTTALTMDTSVFLITAAIAIPNLLRARITANEASAVGSLRVINTAQVQYAVTYPERGFAPDLATLGPGPDSGPATPEHADFLDPLLGGPGCTGETWCQKSGYRFRVTGVCKAQNCEGYLVVAAPITPGTTGVRSFCSTSDGVIRFTADASAALPSSVETCKAWPPLQ